MRRFTKRRVFKRGRKGRIFRAKRRISRKARNGNLQHFKLSYSQHMSWQNVLATGVTGIKGGLQNPNYVVTVNNDTNPNTVPLSGFAPLAGLFDSYKVNGIKVTIVYDQNVKEVDLGSATESIPTAYSFYDPDMNINSSTAGMTIDNIVQYENSRIHTNRTKLTRYFKSPRYTQNYVGNPRATLAGGFFDMESGYNTSSDYPMFGVWGISWGAITTSPPNTSTGFFIKVDYYISAKNRK